MAAKRLYEGMFLVDSGLAAADWEGTLAVVENILKRADADVVVMRKWDERRLAYELDHKSRGTYILCYFKADPGRIAGIEKDVQLSEKVMRVLVLGTEKRPSDVIEQCMAGPAREGQTPEPVAPDAAETSRREPVRGARGAAHGRAEPVDEPTEPSADEQDSAAPEAEVEMASETSSDDVEKS